ncbi:penicillin-binding protein activator [Marinomonas mediterranea]|uniref:LppC family lipoprotein n=1 Tax=Marinomonas mediterranea (strain ATCC 700492 / JCM 21426 / NBRC 103028 / MMB-1) TaxID=717774 RepID=F2JU68_MARM1|nr:penicillin-binding protein activator [Marinomonas mediterranea]ADZ91580.1 LppC family lipoprotein [Marinomonas mediterranea MMB-1]WCN13621.1 penicillin-binding protein activator [Marinomonas mediterranea]WCN17684.1 penicillin-binding protein activator [Marinomonas mediterranea MMB-1]
MRSLHSRIIALSTFTLLLVGCGSIETNEDTASAAGSQPEIPLIVEETAPTDPVEFALWRAQNAESIEQSILLYFHAAKEMMAVEEWESAASILNEKVTPFSSSVQFQGYLLLAQANAELQKPLDALSALSRAKRLPIAQTPASENQLGLQRALVLEALENWPATLKERLKLSLTLPPDQRADNQSKLWLAAQNLTNVELDYLRNDNNIILRGWLDVSSLLRDQSLTLEQQLNAFSQWRTSHPSHPASINPPIDFQLIASLGDLIPTSIALMLPMSNELKPASDAILEGFLKTYYATTGLRPKIKVIDTDQYEHVEQAYLDATSDTPDVVIGPLRKSNVARLANTYLSIPTITLNRLENNQSRDNLFYFSLNVADDISELINVAKQAGAEKAAILTTQATWALRQGDEFNAVAEEAAVPVAMNLSYEDTPRGRQNAIKKILLVDESEKRQKMVSKWIGEPIESISRAREDLDYIFFVGKITDAKQIRPLVDFYFADHIPLLSTNSLNDTPPYKLAKKEDIERILFTEIPELLVETNDTGSTDSNLILRLKAMGSDALLLANRYPVFEQLANARLSAKTGIITLDEQGVFHRRPNIVTYRKGKIVDAQTAFKFQGEETQ